jgi:hypothetical protein
MTIPANTNTTISAWVQNQKRGICCMPLTLAEVAGGQVVEQPDRLRGPIVLEQHRAAGPVAVRWLSTPDEHGLEKP